MNYGTDPTKGTGDSMMDWQAVIAKLRAVSDQHARNAEAANFRDQHNTVEQHRIVSDICYALTAALEAGVSKQPPAK